MYTLDDDLDGHGLPLCRPCLPADRLDLRALLRAWHWGCRCVRAVLWTAGKLGWVYIGAIHVSLIAGHEHLRRICSCTEHQFRLSGLHHQILGFTRYRDS